MKSTNFGDVVNISPLRCLKIFQTFSKPKYIESLSNAKLALPPETQRKKFKRFLFIP